MDAPCYLFQYHGLSRVGCRQSREMHGIEADHVPPGATKGCHACPPQSNDLSPNRQDPIHNITKQAKECSPKTQLFHTDQWSICIFTYNFNVLLITPTGFNFQNSHIADTDVRQFLLRKTVCDNGCPSSCNDLLQKKLTFLTAQASGFSVLPVFFFHSNNIHAFFFNSKIRLQTACEKGVVKLWGLPRCRVVSSCYEILFMLGSVRSVKMTEC